MRKVNSRYAALALLTMALIVCGSLPSVFTQNQPSEPRNQVVTEEIQKALLKQQVLDQIAIDKARFVEGIVVRWASLSNDGGAELRNHLLSLSDDRLADASNADSLTALHKTMFGTDDIGSESLDLVFNRVTPCRIIDTRIAGGILTVGAPRDFHSQGPFTDQGGSSGGCGLPSSDTAALVLTLAAVNPTGNGNLRAYQEDTPAPTAVAVNYNAGINLANTTIVPLKQDDFDQFEFTLEAFLSNTHVVADVVGYFWANDSGPLNCTTITAVSSVATNNFWSFSTAVCSGDRSLTGGGVKWSTCSTNVWLSQSSPSGSAWFTQGFNACGSTITVTAYARCCQIPGV